jgi:hypothetical protein
MTREVMMFPSSGLLVIYMKNGILALPLGGVNHVVHEALFPREPQGHLRQIPQIRQGE